MKLRALLFSAVLVIGLPAEAATLIVNSDGQLTGAKNVLVENILYDVNFVDGLCSDIFSGCNAVSDFAFQTNQQAYFAAEALNAQVFIDGPSGNFGSLPSLTFGCGPPEPLTCSAYIPYGFSTNGSILGSGAANIAVGSYVILHPGISADFDSATSRGAVWARFSASAVPEPATWATMLVGFGLIGGAMRYRRRPQVSVRFV